jgi:hypothetical protein
MAEGLLIILVSTVGKLMERMCELWCAELDIKPSSTSNMVLAVLAPHHNFEQVINI